MLDQIVQGRAGSSYVSSAQCMPTRDVTLENTEIVSITSKDSYTISMSEVTSGGLQQYMEHKRRLFSTDSGVECNHLGVSNNGDCPCKRNEHVVEISHPPLTEAASRPSTHNLQQSFITCTKHNQLRDESCSLLLASDNTSSNSPVSGESELVEGEDINSDVFKSTEQNGNYITQETFNEMVAVPSTLTTQHVTVGNYVRPETLQWDDNTRVDTAVSTFCHGSVSTDSGHVDDNSNHSDEVTSRSHETQPDLQFNSDGYVTSPVDYTVS